MIVNRNKRGIGLNLKTTGGRDVLKRLLADADVVTENFRSGTMEKFGLGYERGALIDEVRQTRMALRMTYARH